MVDPGGQRLSTYSEWLIQVEGDLVKREFSSEGNAIPHIFRVPAQIREVSEDSFDSKFPFGLYDLETRANSVLDTYRKDFAKVFMQITGKEWKEICLEVVGDSPEKVEFWVKLYHGLDLESIIVGRADTKGKTKESDRIDFIRTWLTLDAIFIVCFIQADHQLRCHRCRKHFPDFNKEMEKQALKSMKHVIRLDIFKFENQIPLGLIKNVVNMMSMGNKNRDENNCQQHEGDNPFEKFVEDAVRLIYCDLPGPQSPREFAHTVKSIKIDGCRHLLQCLYSVICHKPTAQAPQAPSAQTPPAQAAPGPSAQTLPAQAAPAPSARTPPAQALPGPSAQTPLAHAPPTSLAQTSPAPSTQTTPAQAPPAPSARTPLAQAPSASSAQTPPAQGPPTPSPQRPPAQAPPSHVIPAQASPYQVPPAQVPPDRQAPPAQGNRKGSHHHNHTDLQYHHVPTVTRLKEAGIRVMVKQDETKCTFFALKNPFVAKCIGDVKFERNRILKGILYLPAIGFYDETESLLRNLLTYEYLVEDQKDLLSFVWLMNNLLDTEQDVKMMKDTGVLKKNSLGSDERVAKVWNTLLTGVVLEMSPHYQKLFNNISVHYYNKRHRLWEEFTSFHLRKPWVVLGSIVVAITFIATLLAMIYTILTYYYGNKQRPSS